MHVRLTQRDGSEVESTLKRSAVVQVPDSGLGQGEMRKRPHNVAFERIKRGDTRMRTRR